METDKSRPDTSVCYDSDTSIVTDTTRNSDNTRSPILFFGLNMLSGKEDENPEYSSKITTETDVSYSPVIPVLLPASQMETPAFQEQTDDMDVSDADSSQSELILPTKKYTATPSQLGKSSSRETGKTDTEQNTLDGVKAFGTNGADETIQNEVLDANQYDHLTPAVKYNNTNVLEANHNADQQTNIHLNDDEQKVKSTDQNDCDVTSDMTQTTRLESTQTQDPFSSQNLFSSRETTGSSNDKANQNYDTSLEMAQILFEDAPNFTQNTQGDVPTLFTFPKESTGTGPEDSHNKDYGTDYVPLCTRSISRKDTMMNCLTDSQVTGEGKDDQQVDDLTATQTSSTDSLSSLENLNPAVDWKHLSTHEQHARERKIIERVKRIQDSIERTLAPNNIKSMKESDVEKIKRKYKLLQSILKQLGELHRQEKEKLSSLIKKTNKSKTERVQLKTQLLLLSSRQKEMFKAYQKHKELGTLIKQSLPSDARMNNWSGVIMQPLSPNQFKKQACNWSQTLISSQPQTTLIGEPQTIMPSQSLTLASGQDQPVTPGQSKILLPSQFKPIALSQSEIVLSDQSGLGHSKILLSNQLHTVPPFHSGIKVITPRQSQTPSSIRSIMVTPIQSNNTIPDQSPVGTSGLTQDMPLQSAPNQSLSSSQSLLVMNHGPADTTQLPRLSTALPASKTPTSKRKIDAGSSQPALVKKIILVDNKGSTVKGDIILDKKSKSNSTKQANDLETTKSGLIQYLGGQPITQQPKNAQETGVTSRTGTSKTAVPAATSSKTFPLKLFDVKESRIKKPINMQPKQTNDTQNKETRNIGPPSSIFKSPPIGITQTDVDNVSPSTASCSDVFPVKSKEIHRRVQMRLFQNRGTWGSSGEKNPHVSISEEVSVVDEGNINDTLKQTSVSNVHVMNENKKLQNKNPTAETEIKLAESLKYPPLDCLIKEGILKPGKRILSMKVKDKKYIGTLTQDGQIKSIGGERFRSPVQWLTSVSGGIKIVKAKAYREVHYLNRPLMSYVDGNSKLTSDDDLQIQKLSNCCKDYTEEQTDVQRNTEKAQEITEKEFICVGHIAELLNDCKILLLDDDDVISSHDLPENFWTENFCNVKLSHSLWNQIDCW